MDFLKGLARGLTADTLGMPVDAITNLLNLGLAGGGTAAHQLGLISPEQLPGLIERPVGGSEWLAEKTGIQGQGGAYEAGRLAPIAGGLAGAAAGLLRASGAGRPKLSGKTGQRGVVELIPEELSGGVPLSGTRMRNITGESDYVLPRERVSAAAWDKGLATLMSRGELQLGELGGSGARIPGIADRKIVHMDLPGSTLGASYPDRDVLDVRKIKNPLELQRVVSHEAQHAVDQLAGRASIGSNPRWMADNSAQLFQTELKRFPNEKYPMGPHAMYESVLGERNARLAEALGKHGQPPSQLTLDVLERSYPQAKTRVQYDDAGYQAPGLFPSRLFNYSYDIKTLSNGQRAIMTPEGAVLGLLPKK